MDVTPRVAGVCPKMLWGTWLCGTAPNKVPLPNKAGVGCAKNDDAKLVVLAADTCLNI